MVKRWAENNAKPTFYGQQQQYNSYASTPQNRPTLPHDHRSSPRYQPQHGRAIRGQRHPHHSRR